MKTMQKMLTIPFILTCLVGYTCHAATTTTLSQNSERSFQQIHSISIEDVKSELRKVTTELKNIAKQTLEDTLPTIAEIVESKYIPMIKNLKDDFTPFFESKLLPKIQKFNTYAKNLTGRIFSKAHQSWELSNSTHINFVSFSDIMEEIADGLQDLQKTGKFFSKSFSRTSRSKRSPQFVSGLMGFARPIFKNMASTLARSFDNSGHSLTSQLILPIIFDMIDDPVTFHDLQRLFWSVQAVVSPIMYEVSKGQYSAYHIPQARINAALQRLHHETDPILRKIFERQLPMILRRSSDNVGLIFSTVRRIEASSGPRVKHLKTLLLDFLNRHGALFSSVGSRYITSRTLPAIKKDLIPIKTTLFEIFLDYMSHNRNSWGNLFTNSFTLLSRM